ncbi:MAG: hypothetical protein L0216_21870 [Planctomycetales bacterium]|nr:hypothetical protein [Planctomycetales bacterium]
MPIELERFKAAKEPLPRRILRLLEQDPARALKLLEIMIELETTDKKADNKLVMTLVLLTLRSRGDTSTWDKYQQAIEGLVKEGKVASAEVGGDTYYASTKNL